MPEFTVYSYHNTACSVTFLANDLIEAINVAHVQTVIEPESLRITDFATYEDFISGLLTEEKLQARSVRLA